MILYIVFRLGSGHQIVPEPLRISESFLIGRSLKCTFSFPEPTLSDEHARITHKVGPEQWGVADLRSTNGTRLNGVQIKEASLKDGDILSFGEVHAEVYSRERYISTFFAREKRVRIEAAEPAGLGCRCCFAAFSLLVGGSLVGIDFIYSHLTGNRPQVLQWFDQIWGTEVEEGKSETRKSAS